MKSKNYTKLHGYENEKVENEEEVQDNSDLEDDLDDDFYSDDYNIFGDDDSEDDFYSSSNDEPYGSFGGGLGGGFGCPHMNRFGSETPYNMGMLGGTIDNKRKLKFFNKNKKPDCYITNTDVENANIKGFLTGFITGVISLLSLLALFKHITSKK